MDFQGLTFNDYVRQYEQDKSVRWIEPMSAHEINILEYQPKIHEFAELKYDGHRGRLEFGDKVRCFSRTVSKKSGWFTENTDNVPHIRDMDIKSLRGTVLDGEFDYGNTSMGVQSVMGALPERAIAFQEENGYIPFRAFDILYYKGVNIQKMQLWKRKYYLALAVMELQNEYVEYAKMYMKGDTLEDFRHNLLTYKVDTKVIDYIEESIETVDSYKELYFGFIESEKEGIMLKSMEGIYEQKRTKHYLKVKGQSTWDCVVMGYTNPTKIYDGKELHKWKYWEVGDDLMEVHGGQEGALKLSQKLGVSVLPVTKPYFMGWIGAIRFGVWKPIDLMEYHGELLSQNYEPEEADKAIRNLYDLGLMKDINEQPHELVHVGDCKGLAEKELIRIKEYGEELVGTVLEVKANGIIDEEIGSLRHPRFSKWREDKSSEMCLWKDHIRKLGGE